MTTSSSNSGNAGNFANYSAEAMKYFQNYKPSGFDTDQWMSIYNKNMELYSQTNQLAAEALRNITHSNSEFAKHSMEQFSEFMRQMMTTGTNMQDKIDVQTAAAKESMRSSLEHGQEISNTINKSGSKIVKMVSSRLSDCIDETGKAAKKATSKK